MSSGSCDGDGAHLRAGVADDVADVVAVVDARLHDQRALARDLRAAQATDQLLALAAEHRAADDLQPAAALGKQPDHGGDPTRADPTDSFECSNRVREPAEADDPERAGRPSTTGRWRKLRSNMIFAASSIEVSGSIVIGSAVIHWRTRASAARARCGDRAHEVALGDDADDPHHVLDDDDGADVRVVHLLGRLADRVRRLDGEDVPVHDLGDRCHGRSLT